MSVLPHAGLATLPVLIALLGACDLVDIGAANRSIAPTSPPPSQTCWTLSPASRANLDLIEVDLDSGTWSELGRFEVPGVPQSFHTGGIARSGDTLVLSGYTGNEMHLIELDLQTWQGQIHRSNDYAVSVATDGNRFFMECGMLSFCAYDTLDDLLRDEPAEVLDDTDIYATRFGAHDAQLYAAWHSTDAIDVHDLAGTHLRTIPLEDFDTWVWGVSVVGDRLHLIDDGRGRYADQGTRIAVFDETTGANVQNVFLPRELWASGLWCPSEALAP